MINDLHFLRVVQVHGLDFCSPLTVVPCFRFVLFNSQMYGLH